MFMLVFSYLVETAYAQTLRSSMKSNREVTDSYIYHCLSLGSLKYGIFDKDLRMSGLFGM